MEKKVVVELSQVSGPVCACGIGLMPIISQALVAANVSWPGTIALG